MILTERIRELVRACFTGIWIQSFEHDDAIAALAGLARAEGWRLANWDCHAGLRVLGDAAALAADGTTDPLAALNALDSLAAPDSSALLVLTNFHRFIANTEIMQALAARISAGKQDRTFVIVLAPVVQIPVELDKLFIVVDHELPDRAQLAEIAGSIATEPGELPEGAAPDTILDASSGLTRFEAEGAYSLALVRHGAVTPETVWELKTGALKKSGLLSLHRGTDNFDSLGGLGALKTFCKRSLLQSGAANPHKRPRGVLLLGVPGTGKSAFAKALGAETGRPTIILDTGALLGSLVGQSEQNTRQALRIVDAMSPAILFLDECEKALAGSGNSGATDSGVGSRMLGSLLTWMADHTTQIYVIATCNDITGLKSEFYRNGRIDGIFFLNTPGAAERALIWPIHLERFQIDPSQAKPADENWTGAEIEACCRLAALLDVSLVEAARNIVPVAQTASESVERLQTWSSGRCLDPASGGIYRRAAASAGKPARKIDRAQNHNSN
jgi:hypothetical protein